MRTTHANRGALAPSPVPEFRQRSWGEVVLQCERSISEFKGNAAQGLWSILKDRSILMHIMIACVYIYIHTHNMYMIVYVYPMHSPVVSIIIDKPSVETNECPDATGTENP